MEGEKSTPKFLQFGKAGNVYFAMCIFYFVIKQLEDIFTCQWQCKFKQDLCESGWFEKYIFSSSRSGKIELFSKIFHFYIIGKP